jgi:hypothetical protein
MRTTALLLAFAMLAAAQPKGRVNHIRVPVWAETKGGEEALDPKMFSARLGDGAARILSVRGPSDDLMIVLVLDFTGDLSLVDSAKAAAIDAIRTLPPKAAVALLRAQDGMRVALDPTTDREALAAAIRDMPVSGKAGFLDTVEDACRIANRVVSKTQLRAAVIYLTDSSIYNHRDDYANPVINSSDSHDMSRRFPEGLVKQKIASLEERLAPLQAPLFVVHLAYRTDRLEQAYQAGQGSLAAATGGSGVFCKSSAEIPEAVAAAFANAASLYELDIQTPEKRSRQVQAQIENQGRALTYPPRLELPE